MVQWAVQDMGGEIPRRDAHLLPDNSAEEAINCDLSAGPLHGLFEPQLIIDLSATPGPVRRAYRFIKLDGVSTTWLPLPSEFSSAVRSPLVNDTLERLYWTNPGEGGFWATWAMIDAGTAPYTLGFIAPDATYKPVVHTFGGSTSVPEVARSYVVTFINDFGEESSPSPPSDVTSAPSDALWQIFMPVVLPLQPPGKNYALPTKMRLYRTVTSQTAGAQFYMVHEWVMASDPPPGFGYDDTTLDTEIINNTVLESTSWSNPPDKLDGLLGMAGGMLVGFTGNTVHFCEPNRPHAWPAGYDQSVQSPIVGMGVWQQSLMIMTRNFPSQGSGTSPANFTIQRILVPEGCIARGSIVTDLLGVYYASFNGLVMLNYFGMQNQTVETMTKDIWLTEYSARTIVACRHRSQYLALIDTETNPGNGFMIDYSETRLGIMHLNTFKDAVSIFSDPYSGVPCICANKKIYLWDGETAPELTYLWRSKRFYLPEPENLGACQIHAGVEILTPVEHTTPPLDNGDARLVLPDGVNCVFKLYADGVLRMTRNISLVNDVFGLPSGFLAFEYQFEIIACVPIFSVQLATTMKELKRV